MIEIEFDTAPTPDQMERLEAIKDEGRKAFEAMDIPTRRLAIAVAGFVVSAPMLRAIIALQQEAGHAPLLVDEPHPFKDISIGYVEIPTPAMPLRVRRSKRGQRQIEHRKGRKERV